MEIKIWLDDIRSAPEGYVSCKSVNSVKSKILQYEQTNQIITLLDIDHDLGDFAYDGGDGIELVKWLVETSRFYPIKFHTMNPVGLLNMQALVNRYWPKS